MTAVEKAHIVAGLQTDILRLEGFKPANSLSVDLGLGPILSNFPNATFPLGCVHEFLYDKIEDAAATKGFISGLISSLMGRSGISIWISTCRTVFPPGLKSFGVFPDQFIFIDVKRSTDMMWAMEEALKCGAVTCVIGEVHEMSFTTSRRFQLAVEQSQVTGFMIRSTAKKINATACVSRWKITSVSSESIDNLPGLGYPKWKVDLLRMRNGKPGSWEFQWVNGNFCITQSEREDFNPFISHTATITDLTTSKKTG